MRAVVIACLVALGVTAAGPSPAAAQSVRCDTDPVINVRLTQEKATVVETATIANLQAMVQKRGGETGHPLGLYRGQIQYRYDVKYKTVPTRSGICVGVETLIVNVNLNDPVINIAKEIAGQACTRRGVLDHEIVHLRIDQMLLDEYRETLERRLRRLLEDVRTTTVRDQPAAQREANRIGERVKATMDQVFKALGEERKRWHARLDSKPEYRRVGQACADGRLGPSRPVLCREAPRLCRNLDEF